MGTARTLGAVFRSRAASARQPYRRERGRATAARCVLQPGGARARRCPPPLQPCGGGR